MKKIRIKLIISLMKIVRLLHKLKIINKKTAMMWSLNITLALGKKRG